MPHQSGHPTSRGTRPAVEPVARGRQRSRNLSQDENPNHSSPRSLSSRAVSPLEEPSITQTHPRSRRRISELPPCCDCSRFATCSAAPQTQCACRDANRECTTCTTGARCRNKPPSQARPPILPPPGGTELCSPIPQNNRGAAAAASSAATTQPLRGRSRSTSLPRLLPRDRDRDDDEDDDPSDNEDDDDDQSVPSDAAAPTDLAARLDAAVTLDSNAEAGRAVEIETMEAEGGESVAVPQSGDDDASGYEGDSVVGDAVAGTVDDWEKDEDLSNQICHPVDQKLIDVYGDTIHRNGGEHLNGGIADDAWWQDCWRRVVANPHPLYDPPKGAVGQRFVSMLALEWKGVRERSWNSERPIIFAACILRKKHSTARARDIRKRVSRQMDLWEEGMYSALVNETAEEASRGGKNGMGKEGEFESMARRFSSTVMSGQLRKAVRMITSRDGGRVLVPEDLCTKTGRPVREVMQEKHPETRLPNLQDPNCVSYPEYPDGVPDVVPICCTSDCVAEMAPKLSGGAGPSGVEAVQLKHWLLHFGRASAELREEMAMWVDWLANSSPPWAAYRASMARRLVGLDKQPGVRPLGIGEVWQRLWAKLVLEDAGQQGKLACGSEQLCAGLEAGIEGAIHAVRQRREAKLDAALGVATEGGGEVEDGEVVGPSGGSLAGESVEDEEAVIDEAMAAAAQTEQNPFAVMMNRMSEQVETGEGLTLVDARNGFNELSRLAMLWNIRHLWPKGSRFAFNCYRHEVMLVFQNPGKEATILWSKEGVTQGDPMAMMLYGIAILPLAQMLKKEYPSVLQPWYADDSAMMGPHALNAKVVKLLVEKGPCFGYYPEPEKSWHICSEAEEPAAMAAFDAEGLQVRFTRGQRYVGGYIGSAETQEEWLAPMMVKWTEAVKTFAAVAGKYPQTTYAGFAMCLQLEWQYVCQTTPFAMGCTHLICRSSVMDVELDSRCSMGCHARLVD